MRDGGDLGRQPGYTCPHRPDDLDTDHEVDLITNPIARRHPGAVVRGHLPGDRTPILASLDSDGGAERGEIGSRSRLVGSCHVSGGPDGGGTQRKEHAEHADHEHRPATTFVCETSRSRHHAPGSGTT
jgi:hypothetical protein